MTPLFRLNVVAALCLLAAPAAADQEAFATACSTDPIVPAFTPEACGCLYDGINEDFTAEQMTTISTLFSGSPSEAVARLSEGSESDQDVANRIDDIEEALESCDF